MSLLDKSAMTSRDNLVRRLMKTRRNGAGGHNAESGPASGHAALSPNESEAGGAVEAESQSRIGYLDFFSEGQVVGWMYDPAQAVSLAKIFVDDLCIGIVSCDEERNDVVASGYPASTRGFRHDLPAEFLDGDRHELKVTFLDGEPLRISNGFESKKSLTFQSNFTPEFLGNVDGIEGDLVSGWLLMQNRAGGKKTGGGKIAIYCDGILAGQVRASESRPDVADHFKSETYCGFTFQIPSTFLKPSTRVEVATFPHRWTLPGSPLTVERLPTTERAQLRMLERNLERISIDLWRTKREIRKITAAPIWMLPAYGDWASIYFADLRRRAPRARERSTPTVSVLCPVYRPRLRDFVAAIDSVVAQTYPHWELVIVDDCSGREDLTAAIDHYAARDPRVKVHRHSANKGISDATNTAIAAATGDLIAFFDHDDLLVDCALDFMVDALVSSQAIMAYSDEDKIDDRGTLSEPNFKSDWNLRLMLAQNYVCHLVVVRRDAVLRAGPFSTKYNGAQDHDFILRLSEVIGDNAIRHVPEVLYHWRKTPNSTAETVSNKTYAIDAGVAVVADYLVRNRIEAQVTSRGAMTNYIIGWPRRAKIDVSIIVPLKDNAALTRRCLKALRANTEQAGVEIILVNNFSLDAETAEFLHEAAQMEHVRVLDVEEPFNYSRINNIAVASCQSEYILFLNNDVIVDDRDWLDQLVGELCWRGDVGAVGCKLLYESGKVQHAGVVLGVGDGRVAEHPFRGLEPHDPGFMGRALCSQEYSAVTAACLLTRRDVFDEVGGFDEADLAVAFNDVDLCLKIRKAGYRVVWRAETKLEHRESASRSSDMGEHKLPRFIDEHHVMHARWGDELANDPFYNRNFSRDLGVFKAMRIID